MTYSIIGLGGIGSAIARAFAAKGIEVTVAGRRSPEELAPLAAQIGPSVIPRSIREAVQADVVILAVPFATHRDVARASADWSGKIVIDAMNAFGVPPEDLDGLPSTTAVARAFTGAKLVKAFNHLPTATLAQGPTAQGGRRVVFVSGDDDTASATVSGLVDRLGFAPVELGKVAEGGMLVQARGRTWGRLIFQDLVKFA
jgi:predicted dinucleotide-binding enzyme